MPKRKQPPRSPDEDRDAFIAAAAELECDASADDFASTVKKVMQAPAVSNDDLKIKNNKKD